MLRPQEKPQYCKARRPPAPKNPVPLSRSVNHFKHLLCLQCFPPSNRHETYLRDSYWHLRGSQCRTGLPWGGRGLSNQTEAEVQKQRLGLPSQPLTLPASALFNDISSPGLSKAGFDGGFNQIIPAFTAWREEPRGGWQNPDKAIAGKETPRETRRAF